MTDDRVDGAVFLRKGSCLLSEALFRTQKFQVQYIARQYRPQDKEQSDLLCKLETIRLFSTHPKYRAVMAEDFYPDDKRVQYRADMILVEDGVHKYSLEVEHKWIWDQEFPWPDVQFLPRKKEKWDDPRFTYGKPTHFIMYNRDASRHLVIFDDTIRNLENRRMVNCQQRGLEELYYVPLDQVHFDYL